MGSFSRLTANLKKAQSSRTRACNVHALEPLDHQWILAGGSVAGQFQFVNWSTWKEAICAIENWWYGTKMHNLGYSTRAGVQDTPAVTQDEYELHMTASGCIVCTEIYCAVSPLSQSNFAFTGPAGRAST
jgi:hypothetical protein